MRFRYGLLALIAAGLSSSSALATANARVVNVKDFGTSPSNDTPDGYTDLLWHNLDTGELTIHYMDKDGFSAINVVGSIDHIDISESGSGYYSGDSVIIDNAGTGGSGLEAKLEIIGPIPSVEIVEPGRDYSNGLIEEAFPGEAGGTGFIGVTTCALGGVSGQLVFVSCLEVGVGYENENSDGSPYPHVLVAFPPTGGEAAFALCYANSTGQIISDENSGFGPVVIEKGSGFSDTPTFQFLTPTLGTGAEFQAYLNGGIKFIVVVDPGSSYTSNPEFILPGDGNGAVLLPSRGPGPIHEITVTSPGRGYGLSPALTIDGDGTGAMFEFPINHDGPQPISPDVSGLPHRVNGGLSLRVHAGDFDGDGDADILFRREQQAQTYIWFMEDGKRVDGGEIDAIVDDRWHVAGTGDFDNDGADDIYWWNHLTGRICIWHIDYVRGNPKLWLSDRSTFAGWVPNTDWHPFSIRDITSAHAGDEILWGNIETGAVAVRLRNPEIPKHLQHSFYVRAPGGALLHAGENWVPRHFGDFDSNKFDGDIFWHNPVSGRTAVWRVSLSTVFDRDYLSSPAGDAQSDYHPVGVTHYFLEDEESGMTTKHAHILWRHNPTGRVVNWRMDRSTNISQGTPESEGDKGEGAGSGAGSSGEGDYDDGMLRNPFLVDRAVLCSLDGVNADLDFQSTSSGTDEFGGETDGGKEEEGSSDDGTFDVNNFDPLDMSTWPSGVSTPEEMMDWLVSNVTEGDSTTWPDLLDEDDVDGFNNWLTQQLLMLGTMVSG